MTSSPCCSRAAAISSSAVVPQSAVIRTFAPAAASCGDRFVLQPVAFAFSVGDEGSSVDAGLTERFGQDGGSGDAVDVVVAVDRDRFAAVSGQGNSLDCGAPVAEYRGVGGLVPLGVEKLLRCGDGVDAALAEQSSDE